MGVVRVTAPSGDRSIGELFGDLAHETGTLVRQELRLATTEIADKARFAGKKSVMIVAGALVGVAGLTTLSAAIVIALAMVMPLWASALIVAAVLAAVAVAMIGAGVNALEHMNLRLEETAASLKEDQRWMTKQIS